MLTRRPDGNISGEATTVSGNIFLEAMRTAKADLIIIDDFGLAPLPDAIRRDLLEILDDRYDRKSTLITSQLPVEQWHTYLEDPTVADAILDRLIHASRMKPAVSSLRMTSVCRGAI